MEESSANIKTEIGIESREPVAGAAHTCVLLLILILAAIAGYMSMRGRSASRAPNRMEFYLITMIWEWCVFGYIYWGMRRRGKSFRAIAGKSWQGAAEFFRDVGIAAVFWIAALVILRLVALAVHSNGMVQAARSLAPNGLMESVQWLALSITAGICEETIFRGYLQRQFGAWTHSVAAGVLISAILFGAGHVYQGWRATIVIGVYGLLFGILAETRKNLRPGMMVHAWHDGITGLALEFLVRHGR